MIERLLTLWAKEPARIVGLIVALLALLVAFGVQISDEQQAAIIGITVAILAILGAEITRANVYSPNSVDSIRSMVPSADRLASVMTPTPDDPTPNG